jgi:hypothetical protein
VHSAFTPLRTASRPWRPPSRSTPPRSRSTATLAQHTATLEQILAAVQGGGGALATQRAILRAVASNGHVVHHMEVALAMVPLEETGAQPAHWPAGLTRAQLIDLDEASIDALLADYGLPHGPANGTPILRRRRLAEHIGVPGL